MQSFGVRYAAFLFFYCLGLALAIPCYAKSDLVGDVQAGRTLYWDGISANGSVISGTTQTDIEISGSQFSCVSCHRPSGLGSSEGGYYVPPITGPMLFSASKADRVRRFKEMFQEIQPSSFWAQVRKPHLRPAYDHVSLGEALTKGVDPTGEMLNPIMPRYDLSEQDIADLGAFLRQLSSEQDPGVTKTTIEFATIVSKDSDPAERQAMLDTMQTFFVWMNKDTSGDLAHPNFSPQYRSDFLDAYRQWNLHVWELEGDVQTWPAQLSAYYRAQPVFAVIGGLVNGPWENVGTFCDTQRIPCLFPNSELPSVRHALNGYSLYFSGGLLLEAQVAANYWVAGENLPKHIQQLAHRSPLGEYPATQFTSAIGKLSGDTVVHTQTWSTKDELRLLVDALKKQHGRRLKNQGLVLWTGDEPEPAVQLLAELKPKFKQLVLPSRAIESARQLLPRALSRKVVFSHPYEIPGNYHPRRFRVRAWMHSRRLAVTHPRLQYQTFYSLTLLQYGLGHLLKDFHRDYLIELIEHEAENKLNPGTHPSLALGPGQRFASKGAYMVALDNSKKGGIDAITPWIIPATFESSR